MGQVRGADGSESGRAGMPTSSDGEGRLQGSRCCRGGAGFGTCWAGTGRAAMCAAFVRGRYVCGCLVKARNGRDLHRQSVARAGLARAGLARAGLGTGTDWHWQGLARAGLGKGSAWHRQGRKVRGFFARELCSGLACATLARAGLCTGFARAALSTHRAARCAAIVRGRSALGWLVHSRYGRGFALAGLGKGSA